MICATVTTTAAALTTVIVAVMKLVLNMIIIQATVSTTTSVASESMYIIRYVLTLLDGKMMVLFLIDKLFYFRMTEPTRNSEKIRWYKIL